MIKSEQTKEDLFNKEEHFLEQEFDGEDDNINFESTQHNLFAMLKQKKSIYNKNINLYVDKGKIEIITASTIAKMPHAFRNAIVSNVETQTMPEKTKKSLEVKFVELFKEEMSKGYARYL